MNNLLNPETEKTVKSILDKLSFEKRNIIDTLLNHVGEDENGLELADDQEAVIGLLEEIKVQLVDGVSATELIAAGYAKKLDDVINS
ncbi:MAG: hypothetical protein WCG01_03245 [bacterium]